MEMLPTSEEINLANEAVNKQVCDNMNQNSQKSIFKRKFFFQTFVKTSGYKQVARKAQHFFGCISVQRTTVQGKSK